MSDVVDNGKELAMSRRWCIALILVCVGSCVPAPAADIWDRLGLQGPPYVFRGYDGDTLTVTSDLTDFLITGSAGVGLKVLPTATGNVTLFGTTDVGNTADGKAFYVWRMAEEGDGGVKIFSDQFKRSYILSQNYDLLLEAYSGQKLMLNDGANGAVSLFGSATSGETPRLEISGYDTGGEKNTAYITYEADGDGVLGIHDVNVVYITSKLGIGTSDPNYLLDVDGTALIEDLITQGPMIDVRAYGAIPDDDANDYDAIVDAIAAAQTAGAAVFFPPGVYDVNSTLSITDDNVRFVGLPGSQREPAATGGAVLKFADSVSPCIVFGESPDVDSDSTVDCGISNMRLAFSQGADIGLRLWHCSRFKLVDVVWYGNTDVDTSDNVGISIESGSYNSFIRVVGYGHKSPDGGSGTPGGTGERLQYGIHIKVGSSGNATTLSFTDCDISYCRTGIFLDGTGDLIMNKCAIESCNEYGIYHTGRVVSAQACHFENLGVCVYVDDTLGTNVMHCTDCTFNVTGGASGNDIIWLKDTGAITCDQCRIGHGDATYYAITFTGTNAGQAVFNNCIWPSDTLPTTTQLSREDGGSANPSYAVDQIKVTDEAGNIHLGTLEANDIEASDIVDATNTRILTNGMKCLTVTIDVDDDGSTDDFQFDDDAENTTEQTVDVGDIPTRAFVVAAYLECEETVTGGAAMTIDVGDGSGTDEFLTAAATDSDGDINVTGSGASPIQAPPDNSTTRDIYINATPGVNWNTLDAGRWVLQIWYLDVAAARTQKGL